MFGLDSEVLSASAPAIGEDGGLMELAGVAMARGFAALSFEEIERAFEDGISLEERCEDGVESGLSVAEIGTKGAKFMVHLSEFASVL